MGFGRHRKAEEPTKFEKAIASVAEIVEEKEPEIVQEEKPPVIEPEIVQEEKPPVLPEEPTVKKRIPTKEILNVGIVGDTIEVKEFRAIIKKKGGQINVVLNGIIGDWNQKNYNL